MREGMGLVSVESRPSFHINPQTLIGLMIVGAGLLLLGENLGFLDARRVLAYWPLGIVAVGALMFARAVDVAGRTWAAFLVAVGGWWTLSVAVGWPVRISTVFPLAMVVVGIVIIQRAAGLRRPQAGTADQSISDFAFWAGIERKVEARVARRRQQIEEERVAEDGE